MKDRETIYQKYRSVVFAKEEADLTKKINDEKDSLIKNLGEEAYLDDKTIADSRASYFRCMSCNSGEVVEITQAGHPAITAAGIYSALKHLENASGYPYIENIKYLDRLNGGK